MNQDKWTKWEHKTNKDQDSDIPLFAKLCVVGVRKMSYHIHHGNNNDNHLGYEVSEVKDVVGTHIYSIKNKIKKIIINIES